MMLSARGPRSKISPTTWSRPTARVLMRTASAAIRLPLLPVVSAKKLPKGRVVECAEALRSVSVAAPVHVGDVVAANILGLGVDIVASRDMEAV